MKKSTLPETDTKYITFTSGDTTYHISSIASKTIKKTINSRQLNQAEGKSNEGNKKD
jgi:hypothetical protein